MLGCNYFRLVFLTVHCRVLVCPEVIPGAQQDAGGAEGGGPKGCNCSTILHSYLKYIPPYFPGKCAIETSKNFKGEMTLKILRNTALG